jgi:acetyl-CoA carboxylase carboxyl transferase subunit alpha
MMMLRTPIITVVIGEEEAAEPGDRNRRPDPDAEYSIYSVISPEGCGDPLEDGKKGKIAAESLKLTARDLYQLGVIDEMVKEPVEEPTGTPCA